MLFNSWSFLFIFAPALLLVWHLAAAGARDTARALNLALPLFSLVFYALWGLPFLGLLLAIIAINYTFGSAMAAQAAGSQRRRKLLVLAILVNLAPLIWFKYSWFIIRNLALLLHEDWLFTPPDLPLGISFYTFIQIAWLVGVYRDAVAPAGLARHTLFSSFFAYVISGPIVRYEWMGSQFDNLSDLKAENLAAGSALFIIGLAKKTILADGIGVYADAVFNAGEKAWPISCLEAWFGSLSYTFQLYFDFSGYTDMALGIALILGIQLPENFNSPYKSTGIVDFWRRWHITLSSWLRDFLYIPLGGNREGRVRQYRNLFLTMLIGGAWHGAGWTYIIWGGLHGLMLGVNHFFRASVKGGPLDGLGRHLPLRLCSIIFTFICINFCWVVFRALSLDGAVAIYRAMLAAPFTESGEWFAFLHTGNFSPNNYFSGWRPWALLLACMSICWFFPNSREILHGSPKTQWRQFRWRPTRGWAVIMAFLAFASMLALSRQSAFLYFQF